MLNEGRIVLGVKIKQLRLSKGITQKKMSEDLYITRSCLANYEINKRIPGDEILASIAHYLGVTISDLVQISDAE